MTGQARFMHSTAIADQVLALLREQGPMTTAELAQHFPPPEWSSCGHDDCTRPEHQRSAPGPMQPNQLRERVMYRLHQQGRVNRTPLNSSRPVMWWPPVGEGQ